MLRRSCAELAAWLSTDDGPEHLTVAVNFAAAHIEQAGFVDRVLQTVEEAGIEPENLVIEVTETMMLRRGSDCCEKLQRLRDAGCRVAIDDFGTGYSSLSSLRSYPADALKIDREFISGVDLDLDKLTLVRMIVDLARDLGLRCVAEGIETAGEAATVRFTGCHYAQGYYFHRPSPAAEVRAVLGVEPAADEPGLLSRTVQ